MHRTDADANVANLFADPNPGAGTLGTKLDAAWLNAVQEEVCNLLEAMGVTLVKGTNTQLRDACVVAATALKMVRRDAAGRAKVADPSANDDIDTKGARDTAISTHNGVTNPHSATSAATAERLVLRDASGRTQFADPSAAQDAATKAYVDGVTFAAPTITVFPLAANWSTNNSYCGYWKDRERRVWLKGFVTVGSGAAATIMTMPTGYKTDSGTTRFFPCHCGDGVVRTVQAMPDGTINIVGGVPAAGTIIYLDPVNYLAQA